MPDFYKQLPAVPDSIPEIRHQLNAYARDQGAEEELIQAIELAACEALTNSVAHAFVDRDAPGILTIRATCDTEEMRLVITDNGCGMRPRPDSPGLGVGLPLMTHSTDSLKIGTNIDGGTVISMGFTMRKDRPNE